MFLLLIGASLLYLVLSDLGEGVFLLGGATATVGLVIFQEPRSERALAALREIAQPQAGSFVWAVLICKVAVREHH
jgi:Ca2+-transporting ATPase